MENLTHYMGIIKKQLQKYLNEKLKPFNITGAEAGFIKFLSENNNCRQSELSKNFECDKAHIHRVVSKLVEKDIIQIGEKQELILTSKGLSFVDSTEKALVEWKERMIQGVSKQELDMAKNILKKFADNAINAKKEN